MVWSTVRYDGTSATWNLYESPAVAEPVLNITWSRDFEKELYTIKYTYLGTDPKLQSGYIEHGVTEAPVFNAYYTISIPAGAVDIEWNKTNKAGASKPLNIFWIPNGIAGMRISWTLCVKVNHGRWNVKTCYSLES